MPYKTIKDLPEGVQHVLPHHAQEIYRAAYNNAHSQYFKKDTRRDPEDSLEEICHRVAWGAVKVVYRKNAQGKWVEK
ncbi:MAG: cation transport regulator [Alphaproteobacteria bacterium RIFCSPLOWO2_01_FULL_45_8]|nr:MAG: cation transport regulator [Alphaproteobacteria bacterium GWB1_45_5]OFW76080.1 MAG: cation transport regulator [Alphaproteobacteria bacterium GWA1_45_9]OFW90264.1 MAG: cation transport regulator [Alphaproteobacteria bacterium RIFCSPHIGHO2_01_FULL_41_14]OFW95697.1 MAG: cation transport regulator [Alphaproteobacteria bacterium RIFCSPLOWO2_01_FULL_45_8]HCI48274.1 cation transport regulator [Holosporales bacterium]